MTEEQEFAYKAYQPKVEFVVKEELSSLTLDEMQEYLTDLKSAIVVIEIDLEFKDETETWNRQKAVNALKSYKLAEIAARREIERIK